MKIDIVYNRKELTEIENKTVIVIDVLRASSAIVTAFANGSKSITPVLEVEDALKLYNRDNTLLLCGERKGLKPDNFHFGNSPFDYKREYIEDRNLIYTTTNGTKALLAAKKAKHILIGAFVNLRAVVNKALSFGNDITILCAGREGEFSLEDAFCAGLMVTTINSLVCNLDIEDGARWGYNAVKSVKGVLDVLNDSEIQTFLANTKHGKYLLSIGLQNDIEFCACQNIFDITPEYNMNKLMTVVGSMSFSIGK